MLGEACGTLGDRSGHVGRAGVGHVGEGCEMLVRGPSGWDMLVGKVYDMLGECGGSCRMEEVCTY